MPPAPEVVPEVRFGPVRAHAVSLDEAVDLIARRAASGRGGYVLTPNLDHLALALRTPELAAAYDGAFLSLVDGMPLVAASRLLGLPVRERVAGSDLFAPLLARCAADGLPVYFLGASESACVAGGARLRAEHPSVVIAGTDSGRFDLDADPEGARAALRRARDAGARLIVLCLPTLKQLMLSRFEDDYRPAVAIGAGATLDFYAGEVQRAPMWVRRVGLEWAHRLSQQPSRLWRRYLVENPRALSVFTGMALAKARGRALVRPCRIEISPPR
jgi:N-acetylglucosaminyldiphosphoundecaprenol N-acetyl-beta-D-mannosaminyltransferase